MSTTDSTTAGMRELTRQMTLSKDVAAPNGTPVPPTLQPIPQGELDELLRVFARYDIQACTFSKATAESLDFNMDLPRVLPSSLTLPQVRIHLDNLLISVYQIVKSNLSMYRYWKQDDVPYETVYRKEEATVIFESWLEALEKFLENGSIRLRPSDIKGVLGLRLQIKVAIIMLKTCIDCAPETTFDMYEDQFEHMVHQVETMGDALALKEGDPLDNESTSFTMELGVIHPLFFIATKCRDWNVRRRAMQQLKRAGREGVWEGPIMAIVAERIAQIEEVGVPRGEIVPELSRLHKIDKNVVYESRQVYMEATKAQDTTFKTWETIREMIPF